MANEAVDAMLASRRAFAVAAAGCGKTELLGKLVADPRSGRQLVLTHTHAGVAAIKKRLADLRVPQEKFRLDTIAGWSLRYGAAYPKISGFRPGAEADPDWVAVYPGAERVCRSALGRRVIRESYEGVLIDEYQDCSMKQHALVRALRECVPCRGVGDPLQTVFGFREDPVIPWSTIRTDFDVLDGALREPWRWRRPGCNARLGDWLVAARQQLEATKQLEIAADAPVSWVQHRDVVEPAEAWAAACRDAGAPSDTVVAILKWPNKCKELARRLGGRWPIVERFDDPDLLKLGIKLADADGPTVAAELFEFVAQRMTMMGTELRPIVEAIKAGRGVGRFSKHPSHAARLHVMAKEPTPENALAWLEGVLAHREWWLYRRECVHQLRTALGECAGGTFATLPVAVAAARTRARHRGRLTHRRTIGTPLLVKGLEFDHAVLLWEPDKFSVEGLYVALTRASKSLTIVSRSRTLVPEATLWARVPRGLPDPLEFFLRVNSCRDVTSSLVRLERWTRFVWTFTRPPAPAATPSPRSALSYLSSQLNAGASHRPASNAAFSTALLRVSVMCPTPSPTAHAPMWTKVNGADSG
jgi:DNA helicase-2/ATP-dependent DNA helicase PcrA